jgi:predicted O-methyltransferase YrrM
VPCVSPGGGAALRLFAAATGAKSVAEIGTGTGVSGIYLLRGMRSDGVLTTVEREPSRQALAREAFGDAGFAANQTRMIGGRALDMLPRLADGGYDLVFCDGDQAEWPQYLEESLRLLRGGGLVCFSGVQSAPDRARLLAVREVVRTVRESELLVPAVLPTADGMLCAVKRP